MSSDQLQHLQEQVSEAFPCCTSKINGIFEVQTPFFNIGHHQIVVLFRFIEGGFIVSDGGSLEEDVTIYLLPHPLTSIHEEVFRRACDRYNLQYTDGHIGGRFFYKNDWTIPERVAAVIQCSLELSTLHSVDEMIPENIQE